MIIAINTRILSGDSAISKFLIESIHRVALNQPEHEFIFIAEKEIAFDPLPNLKKMVLPQQSNNRFFWRIWYNYKLPAIVKKLKADILVSADGICSLKLKQPQLLLVNDLAFIQFPGWYTKKYLGFIKHNSANFFNKANLLLAFSQAAKKNIIENYAVEQDKIKILIPSPVQQYAPVSWEDRETVKEQYTQGREYFLFNGIIRPGSNLLNLLKAFSLFKKRQKSNMQLIIASTELPDDDAFINSISSYKYRNEVKLVTAASEKEINTLVTSAYACINTGPLHSDVSTLLNAMQSNVPVIAGNLYVAIELLEDAALFAEASVPENIAEKLMLMYKDENKRNDLVTKGAALSKKYTLSETAVQLWQNILLASQSA